MGASISSPCAGEGVSYGGRTPPSNISSSLGLQILPRPQQLQDLFSLTEKSEPSAGKVGPGLFEAGSWGLFSRTANSRAHPKGVIQPPPRYLGSQAGDTKGCWCHPPAMPTGGRARCSLPAARSADAQASLTLRPGCS